MYPPYLWGDCNSNKRKLFLFTTILYTYIVSEKINLYHSLVLAYTYVQVLYKYKERGYLIMNLEDYLIFKGNKKADYYTNVSSLL